MINLRHREYDRQSKSVEHSLNQGQQTFSVKIHIVNVFNFASYTVSAETIQFYQKTEQYIVNVFTTFQ